jgi:hypothetical protein
MRNARRFTCTILRAQLSSARLCFGHELVAIRDPHRMKQACGHSLFL